MFVDTGNLETGLKSLPLFDRLIDCCGDSAVYVVGGAVRDALIGHRVRDVDLIFPEDPTAVAKSFAKAHGGHWFWLDEDRRQSRVVFDPDEVYPVFDFAPFRASSLDQDLFDRDFTINAIALSLSADFTTKALIDPVCGLADLQQDLLRMVSRYAFANDPLRIVKGVRHATALHLQIEEKTLDCMQAGSTELCRVAPERIRQEIWQILASEEAARGLHLLSQSMVGNSLFGNDYSEKYCDLSEALVVVRNCWRKLSHDQPVIRGWLAREVEQGLNYETLLLWTLLLSRLDNDLPGRLAEAWLLSRKVKTYVKSLAGIDEETLKELVNVSHGQRAFAWWARTHDIEPRLLLLVLAAIDALNTHANRELVRDWVPVVDSLDIQPPEELVDGHWLQDELGLPAGPEMSRALTRLRNAEISGRVDSTESAREYLLNYYKNID
jgi:poly(A) polymerase